MDSLSTILDSVRLASAAVSSGHFTSPWAVCTQGAPAGIFHAVLQGSAFIVAEGETEPTLLNTGDVVVLPGGHSHTIASAFPCEPVSVRDLRSTMGDSGLRRVFHGGPGEPTRIFCGTFHLDHDAELSLLSLLPKLMVVSARSPNDHEPTSATLALLDHEISRDAPGSRALISRLCDILFVQVLREHVSRSPAGSRGWLAALRDEHVGKALALIHEHPAEHWDVKLLASRAGTSRSRLFARFSELVGEPPARYAARFRILTAADMLRRRKHSIAHVAERVGYSSEDAFIKAFKRLIGHSPSEYRKKLTNRSTASRLVV
ncbi:MAG: AraC family transcriptional regulator [Polyangiaceae bacterium]|nr:AraC family transcriptional regulator [Polyangiaceae bacterium]